MSAPIELRIADQQGLNVQSLWAAIANHYRTLKGRPVKIKVGQGLHIDGLPLNTWRLVDDETVCEAVSAAPDGLNLG